MDISQLSDVRVEAVLNGGGPVDPTNVFPGETVQFRLTGLNAAGVRQTVTGVRFTTDAPASVGAFTAAGLFTARAASPTSYTVRTTAGSATFTSPLRVANPALLLTGRARLVDGTPAPLLGVVALNAAGAVVGNGRTASDGTFRIAATPDATRLTLDFSIADPSSRFYVRQFAFKGTDYSTVVAGCTAPLPALGGATSVALGDLVVYSLSVSNPPPPPDGCGAFTP